jgi:YesN/AraC family two-component response regulator
MSTVLVIDDEEAIRGSVRTILEAAGHTVLEAENGVSGVELFSVHRPHLVITDILMPVRDGLETVRAIRAIDPQARIIAMSGGGEMRYANFLKAVREFGAAETIEKPFRRAAFLEVVARVLKTG